ncbi:MAG: hypothetical protein ACREA7_02155 [Nitrosotalea sp.]
MMSTIFMLVGMLSNFAGQVGPNYDPLFYDVMTYIFATMMFAVFLLGAIAFWLRVHGMGEGAVRERWVAELNKHFEREGIGLIPDNGKYW